MTLERFIGARSDSWSELEGLLRDAKGKPERLGAERVRRLGALYREAAADLALARRRYPGDPVRRRLEQLVGRAGVVVYAGLPAERSPASFFLRDYWRAVAERPLPILIAWLALLGPGLLAALWALSEPSAASAFIGAPFQGAIDPPTDSGASTAERAVFSAELFTNNIQVTFIAFAAGILFGIGSIVIVALNGLLLGAVTGAAIEAGNGAAFFSFIVPHGPLELSCIAITAAAGMRLGWSLVDPGELPRRAALVAEARRSVLIVLGTMPWLVLAGLIEAFVRSAALPQAVLIVVGLGAFALFWGLVLSLGRARPARRPRRALRSAPATSP